MPRNVFSVPIFFIVFRETLEAAIIISVLLGLVEQIVHEDPARLPGAVPLPVSEKASEKEREKVRAPRETATSSESNSHEGLADQPELTNNRDASSVGEEPQVDKKPLLRKMRLYIFAGAFLGLFLALAIGAAFIAVWFTQASDLWAKSEELWEGTPYESTGSGTHLADPSGLGRYLRAHRIAHHLRHGREYAQDGSREGEMAGQARARLLRSR